VSSLPPHSLLPHARSRRDQPLLSTVCAQKNERKCTWHSLLQYTASLHRQHRKRGAVSVFLHPLCAHLAGAARADIPASAHSAWSPLRVKFSPRNCSSSFADFYKLLYFRRIPTVFFFFPPPSSLLLSLSKSSVLVCGCALKPGPLCLAHVCAYLTLF